MTATVVALLVGLALFVAGTFLVLGLGASLMVVGAVTVVAALLVDSDG